MSYKKLHEVVLWLEQRMVLLSKPIWQRAAAAALDIISGV